MFKIISYTGQEVYKTSIKADELLKANENLKKEADKLTDIYFVGRLANYKYFNMDQAFKNTLDLFKELQEPNKLEVKKAGKKLLAA